MSLPCTSGAQLSPALMKSDVSSHLLGACSRLTSYTKAAKYSPYINLVLPNYS